MKYLLLTILILFTGCKLTKQQRVDNRVVKKIEKIKTKYPNSFKNATTEVIRIDTVLKEVKLKGEVILDTVEVEILLTEYLHDTVKVDRFITRFINTAKDTIQVDSLGLHLWIEGVAIRYSLLKDSAYISKQKSVDTLNIQKTEVINKVRWWSWALFVLGIIFGLIIRSKL